MRDRESESEKGAKKELVREQVRRMMAKQRQFVVYYNVDIDVPALILIFLHTIPYCTVAFNVLSVMYLPADLRQELDVFDDRLKRCQQQMELCNIFLSKEKYSKI